VLINYCANRPLRRGSTVGSTVVVSTVVVTV